MYANIRFWRYADIRFWRYVSIRLWRSNLYTYLFINFISGAYIDIFNPNNPNNPNIELDEADVGTTETVCVSIVTLTAGTFSGTVMILGLDANGG